MEYCVPKTDRRRFYLQVVVSLWVSALLASPARAQSEIRVDAPKGDIPILSWMTRPYRQRIVPPVTLSNSPRLDSLIRAGVLYLTAADVVALAVENNLDIEVQRYA